MSGSSSRSTIVALVAACAMFMENLDSTVVSTALPAMALSFHAAPVNLSLGITAYILSLAVFIPISGWLADRFGARRVFCAAIGVFTVASVLCGACQTLTEFAASRCLQGLGGAMMVPVGRLVVLRQVEKADLVTAFAYFTLPPMFAPLLGAPLGGFITTYLTWRWIFFVNVPIGVLGIVLALLYIHDTTEPVRHALDWRGFILSSLAISGVVLGLELAAREHIDILAPVALMAGGVVLAGFAVLHARQTPHPLVDYSLLRIPTFSASVLSGALYRVACGAIPFVLPLMLQIGLGMSAFSSGLLTISGGAGGLIMKRTAKPILRYFGFRRVLLVNGVISGLSMLLCCLIVPGMSPWLILALLLVGGFFRSLQFTALIAIAWADIPPSKTSAATSLFGMIQQVSFSAGIAFGALLLHGALVARGETALEPGDFSIAFVGIGVLSLVNVLTFLPLPSDAGAEVSGHTARAIGRTAPIAAIK